MYQRKLRQHALLQQHAEPHMMLSDIFGHMSTDHWQRALSHHVASHSNSSYSTLSYAILVNILRIANYYCQLLSATPTIPFSATLFSGTLATLLLYYSTSS